MNKNIFPKSLNLIIFLLVFISCKDISQDKNDTQLIENNDFKTEKNNFNFLPTSTTNQIVVHDFYTLSYNEKYEQAEWVAYFLEGKDNNSHYGRPFFIEDPLVKTQSASWRNYKKSGYDKGHLCPAGDMKQNKKAYDDTFYTSNISPQDHDFNIGIWNRLEEKTRYWATKYNGIYVITAGVLTNNLEEIGHEGVAVPEYFYKILLKNDGSNYKLIAFLIPNKESKNSLYEFVVSVDEIEKLTGIDFYPSLPDTIENQLEKSKDYKDWAF